MINQFIFNLNSTVKVQLNENGYQRLADLHNRYIGTIPNWDRRDAEHYKGNADQEGYTSFQMWDFMEKFGDTVGLCKSQPFSLDIVFEAKDLKAK